MNVDESLLRAASIAATWNSDAAFDIASEFQRGIDWDEGAGERWLRVIDGDRVIALVSTALPLVMSQHYQEEAGNAHERVVTIMVDDLDLTELSGSLAVLKEVFGSPERFELLDSNRFSANDLWYATV